MKCSFCGIPLGPERLGCPTEKSSGIMHTAEGCRLHLVSVLSAARAEAIELRANVAALSAQLDEMATAMQHTRQG